MDDKYIKAEVKPNNGPFNDEREKKGYSDLGQIVINCGDCEEDLAIIQKVKDTEEENKFKAECCKCGGESFIHRINGKVYIDAVRNKKFVDVIVGETTIIKVE